MIFISHNNQVFLLKTIIKTRFKKNPISNIAWKPTSSEIRIENKIIKWSHKYVGITSLNVLKKPDTKGVR